MSQITETPTTKNLMEFMDLTGDTKVEWDPSSQAETAAAEAQFDVLTKKGYKAWRLSADGSQGESLNAFDPKAKRILLTPRMVGG